jgi:hypothetical protein
MADVKLQAALVQKWIGISASESMMFLIARRRAVRLELQRPRR